MVVSAMALESILNFDQQYIWVYAGEEGTDTTYFSVSRCPSEWRNPNFECRFVLLVLVSEIEAIVDNYFSVPASSLEATRTIII